VGGPGFAPLNAAEVLRNKIFKARVVAHIEYGSFFLKRDTPGRNIEIMSVALGGLHVTFMQRLDTFETNVSLTNILVRDGSSPNTHYPLILGGAGNSNHQHEPGFLPSQTALQDTAAVDPSFLLKVEANPGDPSAGYVVTIRTHDMDVVYHRGYIEALHEFFRLPESQLQSIQALKEWLMQLSSLSRWIYVAGQMLGMLFSLRIQDEREMASVDGSTFVLQLSTSIKARIIPPSPSQNDG
jgi:hypothetical protein